ncbi:MAG: acyl-CoA dehydrogenase family protein [Pseudomonadota bacterium]
MKSNSPGNGSKIDWNALDNEAFRHEVRSFFEDHYPSHLRYPKSRMRWQPMKDWTLTLAKKGWLAPSWPVEHGGMGLAPEKMIIFIEEQERWGVGRAPDMGIIMIGPLLIQNGSEEQKREYLPKILACEHIWCQGYSEPNAGSDLASLRTEAILDGDEFVVNGQKIWTTLAQDATHMILLVRTDKSVKLQQGISFLLMKMDSPGVTVRPLRNIAGHEEFCEVFFDNVRVPKDGLVGDLNQGWTISKALLGFERIAVGGPKQSQNALARLEEMAVVLGLDQDAGFLDRFTQLRFDVADHAALYMRFVDQMKRGEKLGPEVSILKVWATETFSRLANLIVEAAGSAGATVGDVELLGRQADVMTSFYNARPPTIYGGTNEIQRNIIASQVLNLPS